MFEDKNNSFHDKSLKRWSCRTELRMFQNYAYEVMKP